MSDLDESVGNRKVRLEELLANWRPYPYWLPRDGIHAGPGRAPVPVLEKSERERWDTVLRACTPLPPRSVVEGFRLRAEFLGVNINELLECKAALILGRRVAIHFGSIREIAPDFGGHTWAIHCEDSDAEGLLKKRFRVVARAARGLLAEEPTGSSVDLLASIVMLSAEDPSAECLDRWWRVSSALSVDHAFTQIIDGSWRTTLGGRLAHELAASASDLGLAADGRLVQFSEGRDSSQFSPWMHLLLPNSRFTELVTYREATERLETGVGNCYFEDLASACAMSLDAASLAELLHGLPPGRVQEHITREFLRNRPELLAAILQDPRYFAEAASALVRLPQKVFRANAQPIELGEQWRQIQRLGRRQLFSSTQKFDVASWLAFGILDESDSVGESLGLRLDERHGEWLSRALEEPETAERLVAELERQFKADTKLEDGAFVFALKVLRELQHEHAMPLRIRVATAVVNAYVKEPRALGVHASLLGQFGELLVAEASLAEVRQRWLRPFDVRARLREALADQNVEASRFTSESPQHRVPELLLAHADTLLAQAERSPGSDDLLAAALELYFEDHAVPLHLPAFSWFRLSQEAKESNSIFARVGRLLDNSASGPTLLRRILRDRPDAHVLAYLLLGLRRDSQLSPAVSEHLKDLVSELLADPGGISIGRAIGLAALLQSTSHRDSERLARRVLSIVSDRPKRDLSRYADSAQALIALALAHQQSWAELAAFQVDVSERHPRDVIANLRAVGCLQENDLVAARQFLDQVLRESPHDAMALTNLTSLFVRSERWRDAVAACERAMPHLGRDERDVVLQNKARALRALGELEQLQETLDQLSPRERGALETESPTPTRVGQISVEASPKVDDDTKEMKVAPTDPLVDIAIITILPEEYAAVRAVLDSPQIASAVDSFPNVFGWVVGEIKRKQGARPARVALAHAGQPGNVRASLTTLRTIDRFRPKYLLVVGVAGGLAKDGIVEGDVVVSSFIWHYEYGKVDAGRVQPRHRYTFRVHGGLLSSAALYAEQGQRWRDCGVTAPRAGHLPKFRTGAIASGEKVIDDLTVDVVREVLTACPELRAIEMEGAGASAAVEQLRDEGRAIGFLMVRGISDCPKEEKPAPGVQSVARDNWKPYAAALAARFVAEWIGSNEAPPLD